MSALPQPTGDQFTSEKRPRHYAAEYVKLPTKPERALYWQTIPIEFRAMVMIYARQWHERNAPREH